MCCSRLASSLLILFDAIFVLCGTIVFVIGVVIQTVFVSYDVLVVDKIFTAPALLITAGLFTILAGTLSCYGVWKQNPTIVSVPSVLLCLAALVEFGIGIMEIYLRDGIPNSIDERLQESFQNWMTDGSTDLFWNNMQTELKCCGINGPYDWNSTFQDIVPYSCCTVDLLDCNITLSRDNPDIHQRGCEKLVTFLIQDEVTILAAVSITLSVIQLVLVMFYWCSMSTVKKQLTYRPV